MEKLFACLKIYETKYPKEKSDAPLLISSQLLIQSILAVVICLWSTLLSPPVPASSLHAAHERPEGVCGEWDSYPIFPPPPAAVKQTSHNEFLQNQEEFFVNGNELKKNSPSELPLTPLVWGRETRAWMFWLEAWKFITSAVYCECNFLGVCCVLKTAPSWFCSKCIERNPLCFVIVLASASHHPKII